MTNRQKEIIKDNLRAFVHNFGDVRIETAECGGGFYVYYPADSDGWLIYCPNIHFLDGWLYGAVQGVRRVEPARIKYNIPSELND